MKLSIKTGLLISVVSVIISSNIHASTANVENRARQNVQQLRNDPELRGAVQQIRNNQNVNRLHGDVLLETGRPRQIERVREIERIREIERVKARQQTTNPNSSSQIKKDIELKSAVANSYNNQKTDVKSY